MESSDLIPLKDLAALAGVSDGRLRQLLDAGDLHGIKVGRGWCIPIAEAQRYLIERGQAGRAATLGSPAVIESAAAAPSPPAPSLPADDPPAVQIAPANDTPIAQPAPAGRPWEWGPSDEQIAAGYYAHQESKQPARKRPSLDSILLIIALAAWMLDA